MINARAETLAKKPAFSRLLARQRCLIPADGFYEWKKSPGDKIKTPYRFHLKSDLPFMFAGLWDRWKSPDGQTLRTCTIITTAANAVVSPIHDRMPAMLRDADCRRWIKPGELPQEDLMQMLAPYPPSEMAAEPVSPAVNNATHEGAELIRKAEKAESKPFQPSLFPT
jgi:putative SOS response-associated peptidase YedK